MSETSFYKTRLLINKDYRVYFNYLKNSVSFRSYYKEYILLGNEAATFLKLFPFIKKGGTVRSILTKSPFALSLTLRILLLLQKNGIIKSKKNIQEQLYKKIQKLIKRKEKSHYSDLSLGILGDSPFTHALYLLCKNNPHWKTYHLKDYASFEMTSKNKDILFVGSFNKNIDNVRVNALCLRTGKKWLYVNVDSSSYKSTIGPLISGKDNPCYQCLQERKKENREEDVGSYLFKKNQHVPQHIIKMIEAITAKLVLQRVISKINNKVDVVDFPNDEVEKNYLVQKYNCTACGPHNKSVTEITLNPVRSVYSENGLRVVKAMTTYKKALTITGSVGVINELKENTFKKNYLGLKTWETITANPNSNPYADRKHWGKGLTLIQNKVSAQSEGLERYYAKLVDNSSVVFDSYNNLKKIAVNPEVFTLPKVITYPKYITYNPDLTMDWVWGYSLTLKKKVLIPMVLVNYPSFASSAGLSSGNNMEEAILSGIFEVIERDASMILELNTLCMNDVDISEIHDVKINYFRKLLERKKIKYYVKYITNNVPIPIFQVFLQGEFKGGSVYSCGHGAHLNKNIALLRAITEAIQIYPKYDFCEWIRTRPIEHLYKKGPKLIPYNTIPNYASNNFRDNIEKCVSLLKKENMEVFVSDLSKENVGFKIVRILISNTQPCFAGEHHRLHKRVFEIPKILGLRKTNSSRADLLIGDSPFIRRCKSPAPNQIIYCEK